MNNGFVELADIAALDSFLESSPKAPIVILKHSATCGVSDRAYTELSGLMRQTVSEDVVVAAAPIAVVTVQAARDVSDELEARTGIAHQSPQVLIFVDGKVVWTASHWAVKAGAVRDALRAVGGPESKQ
jgi:bacillithiol system protein YtxJ